ncbi:GNAT family N-acetyltransferase [Phenylobacterium sp.]|uniref:GNAT family N-acetyltransferase n=1 Tax=Phenylobacterium sp. TaxID=1871053 RepID=UPI0035B3241F
MFEIRALTLADLDALAALLVETVDGGGSVSFMAPLALEDARSFWRKSLEAASRGERVVLGAFADGELASTVTLHLDCPPNQPHRGEIAKMMTATAHRGRGAASLVLSCAEDIAREAGRTLLVLDTASEGGASGLYERHGWIYAGEIPDYALKPHGGLVGTRLYYKRL